MPVPTQRAPVGRQLLCDTAYQACAGRSSTRRCCRGTADLRRLRELNRRFGSLPGRRSEAAATAARQNWLSLGALLDRSFAP